MDVDLFGKTKDETAIERIKTFCPPEGYYVAFSGGKDSIVILDLVKRSGVKYDAHYNFTSVDPPELTKFIRENYPDVEWRRPEKTMFQLIVKHGFLPTRKMRYCCSELKEAGGEGRFVLLGIRWAESYGRSKRKMVEACFKNNRTFHERPIIDWTDKDVWDYIKSNNLSYPALYDEGWKRIGCVMCPMAGTAQMLKHEKRWPQIAKAYKNSAIKAVEKRKKDGKLKETNFQTGEEMYHWWIYKPPKDDPDQTVMFE